jgi:hypothetical protein
MARGNPNPVTKFKKGHKKVDGSGRQPGQPNYLTADVRKLIRQAADETGYKEIIPVCDDKGMPTGKFEEKIIETGELAYLKWLAEKHPKQFASLYGRIIPLEMNVKADTPKRVVYPSLEDTRAELLHRHRPDPARQGDERSRLRPILHQDRPSPICARYSKEFLRTAKAPCRAITRGVTP